VQGTITTDGNLGALTQADILDWNLTLSSASLLSTSRVCNAAGTCDEVEIGLPFGIQLADDGIEVRDHTPLPATLPLFATGLGGCLGLLGCRRKRKAQAVA
jgi:hypothetical protein